MIFSSTTFPKPRIAIKRHDFTRDANDSILRCAHRSNHTYEHNRTGNGNLTHQKP